MFSHETLKRSKNYSNFYDLTKHKNLLYYKLKEKCDNNDINSVEKLRNAPFKNEKKILQKKLESLFTEKIESIKCKKIREKFIDKYSKYINSKYTNNEIRENYYNTDLLYNVEFKILLIKYKCKYEILMEKLNKTNIDFECPYVLGFINLATYNSNIHLEKIISNSHNVPFEIVDMYVKTPNQLYYIFNNNTYTYKECKYLLDKFGCCMVDYPILLEKCCNSVDMFDDYIRIREDKLMKLYKDETKKNYYLKNMLKVITIKLSYKSNLNSEIVKKYNYLYWNYNDILKYNKKHYNFKKLMLRDIIETNIKYGGEYIQYGKEYIQFVNFDTNYIIKNKSKIDMDLFCYNIYLTSEKIKTSQELFELIGSINLLKNKNIINDLNYLINNNIEKWDWDYITKYYTKKYGMKLIEKNKKNKCEKIIPWNYLLAIEYSKKLDFVNIYDNLEKYMSYNYDSNKLLNKKKIDGKVIIEKIIEKHDNKIPLWFRIKTEKYGCYGETIEKILYYKWYADKMFIPYRIIVQFEAINYYLNQYIKALKTMGEPMGYILSRELLNEIYNNNYKSLNNVVKEVTKKYIKCIDKSIIFEIEKYL